MLDHFDPRRVHRPAGICLLVSSALLLGACGGGSGDSAGSATGAQNRTTLTKAQFIAKANAICKTGDAALTRTALRAFGGSSATASQRAQYATQTGVPIVERMVNELRALPAPPDEARFDAILATADQQVAAIKQQPSNFGDQFFARTDKLAHAYGLPDC
ncbi:MAG TPA: hypothetical protein VHU24_02995 [Solirubrobacterales bacterium]|jgi:hypothetical protein|nr:hypothetical protein [Solirubrobacterales bacterium]